VCGNCDFPEEAQIGYEQVQPNDDTLTAYFAVGAEPIEAKNGIGFFDKKRLEESSVGEALNKDGTGVKKATRGLDPRKKRNIWLQYVYVSGGGKKKKKGKCEICGPFDGKIFHIDSEDRPCIPRLEEWDGIRPVTHPNCKCKWVKAVIDPERILTDGTVTEGLGTEQEGYLFPDEFEEEQKSYLDVCTPEDFELARSYFGDEFDNEKDDKKKGWMVVRAWLRKLASYESLAVFLNSICKNCKKTDFDVSYKNGYIKNIKCKNCGEPAFGSETDMLKDELYDLLGQDGIDKIDFAMTIGTNSNELKQMVLKIVRENSKKIYERKLWDEMNQQERKQKLVQSGFDEFQNYNAKLNYVDLHPMIRSAFEGGHTKTATEGGIGSGKKGHQRWMVNIYPDEECPNCMIHTEKLNGKCQLCGE